MSKIISVILPKGGVGKSTSTVNLGYYFALQNKKTLLIDLDPTATCSYSLGFRNEDIKGDIFDVFSFSKSINSVIVPTKIKNLDCIPHTKLGVIEEGRQLRLLRNEYLLRNFVAQIAHNYNFIIFDCPPYLFGPTNLALHASNSVLIPIKTDGYSLEALDELLQRIEYVKKRGNQKLHVEGIFITSYEKDLKASFKLKTKLFNKNSNLMLTKSIPKDENLLSASFNNTPIAIESPESSAAIAYKELANEILDKNITTF
ncbi:MAG: hypothetical protein CR986_06375 [Ignavibacteriae bacterium]|nr:MAG: hypothetical protein CR986_06375 [Ignavibacteriota bacterium]